MKGITFFLVFVAFSSLHSQTISLRDTTNQYDYIIITVPEYVSAGEPFKQHKETVRDFRTLIVDTTQIYAEFSSFYSPQSNIRDFISYAGTFWKAPQPKYILIIGTVLDVPNFLIDYQANFYESDYYYSENIFDGDSTTTDFYVGRIPCKNHTELENYINKVIHYENDQTISNWMNNNLFLCDNDSVFGFFDAALDIADNYLPEYIRSYFIVADSGSNYFGDKDSIYNAINRSGCSICWFYGHCNDSAFINSTYFNIDDLRGLSNYPMFYLSVFVSTQHSIIETNTNMSSAMMMMFDSGSLGGLVHVGPSFWGTGNIMRRNYAQKLFNDSTGSIGEAFTSDDLDPLGGFFLYMKKITNLWADPSLKLKYDTTVGVEEIISVVPRGFTLYQNYPNPFNPSTTIKFALPVAGNVNISVYNTIGQLVETLVDKEMQSGYHEVNFNAARLSSGIYFYQLQTGEYVSAKKMVLIK